MTEVKTDKQGRVLDDTSAYVVKRALIGSGWACAPKHMTREEVEAALDAAGEEYIPGVPWTVAPREHEDETLCSPGHCDEDESRQHWFLIGGMSGAFMLALGDKEEGFPEDLVIRGLGEDTPDDS